MRLSSSFVFLALLAYGGSSAFAHPLEYEFDHIVSRDYKQDIEARDFHDEIYARDLYDFEPRDYEDLYSRDFSEFEARGNSDVHVYPGTKPSRTPPQKPHGTPRPSIIKPPTDPKPPVKPPIEPKPSIKPSRPPNRPPTKPPTNPSKPLIKPPTNPLKPPMKPGDELPRKPTETINAPRGLHKRANPQGHNYDQAIPPTHQDNDQPGQPGSRQQEWPNPNNEHTRPPPRTPHRW